MKTHDPDTTIANTYDLVLALLDGDHLPFPVKEYLEGYWEGDHLAGLSDDMLGRLDGFVEVTGVDAGTYFFGLQIMHDAGVTVQFLHDELEASAYLAFPFTMGLLVTSASRLARPNRHIEQMVQRAVYLYCLYLFTDHSKWRDGYVATCEQLGIAPDDLAGTIDDDVIAPWAMVARTIALTQFGQQEADAP